MMDDLTFSIPLKKLCGAQLSSMGPQRIKYVCQPCISDGTILKLMNEVMVKGIFILSHQMTLGTQLCN